MSADPKRLTPSEGFWARMLLILGALLGSGLTAAWDTFWAGFGFALGLFVAASARYLIERRA